MLDLVLEAKIVVLGILDMNSYANRSSRSLNLHNYFRNGQTKANGDNDNKIPSCKIKK